MKTTALPFSRQQVPSWCGPITRVPDFIALTKPRVMALAVFTAAVGLFLAPGQLDPLLGAVSLIGIAAGAGAAGVLNMWYDADIDALMTRTSRRPIPDGKVSRSEALGFGLALTCGAVAVLALAVNGVAAALLIFAIFFYTFAYTIWLKRRTPQNIVIGGAAGALPPVIGWAASIGAIGLEPLVLFLIIFLWTPPHFWALSLTRTDDYARAGVPTFPVVSGSSTTAWQILAYSVLLVPTSVLPCVLGFAGTIYGATAVVSGTIFIVLAVHLSRSRGEDRRAAHRLFVFSISYLFLLFATLLADHQINRWSTTLAMRGAPDRPRSRHAERVTHRSATARSHSVHHGGGLTCALDSDLLIGATMLSGFQEGVLDPKGPIAASERLILFNSLGIMLAIVIPTILATLGVAFWFRASNGRARYRPDFTYSGRLEILVWAIPAMTVMLVGGVAWIGSHDLDPRKPIASDARPITVQVVSLDWKWLFIYPELGIASVNQLTIPVATPVRFELTSSGVMNSFFVPQLGSQIYTMAGMVTRLNVQADHAGTYRGLSAQYSGSGFSDMRFSVAAVPAQDFDKWVATARGDGPVLDARAYADLARPAGSVAPFNYRAVAPDLFNSVLGAAMHSGDPSRHADHPSQRAER